MALLWAVTLLSAAALAFEILLMRLFSVAQWHHFAYMIISVALLGYGASGTVLTVFRNRLQGRFSAVFTAGAVLFSLTVPASFALAGLVPLNTLEIVWDRGQLVYLLAVYLLLAVPFFCAATAIGLALSRPGARIGLVYRSDLIGAAAGAAGIVGFLFVLEPAACLPLIGSLGLTAAALGWWHGMAGRALPLALLAAAVTGPGPLAPRLAHAAAVALQGPESGPDGARRGSDRGAVRSAGMAGGGGEPHHPVPPCPGPEPRRQRRATAPVGGLHRRRRHDRHHPLRW